MSPGRCVPGQFAKMWSFPCGGLSSGETVASLHEETLHCPCASRTGTVGERLAQSLSSEAVSDTGNGCVVIFSKAATAPIAGKFLYGRLN